MPSKRAKGSRPIEVRDQRLSGGRMSLSPRTTHGPTRKRRAAAIHGLLEAGEVGIIERLRSRKLHIADVQAAWEDGDVDRLRERTRGALTLADAMERTIRRVEGTLEEGSVTGYRTLRDALLARWGKERDMASVTREDVEAFLHEPKNTTGAPWSAGRQEVMRALGGAVWAQAIEREAEGAETGAGGPRLTRNPWKAAATRGHRSKRAAFLRPEEWRVLLESVRGGKEAVLLGLGCLAGLRMGEALHLRPGVDLDLEARLIRVQPREGLHPWVPKTSRSVRDVPIGDTLLALIREHLELYAGSRYLIRAPRHDRPLHPSTARGWTREVFGRAGIRYGRTGDGLTFHSLRHTFASWLVQRDVQLKKVALLLGNTVQEVDRTYAHLVDDDLHRAVAVLDATAGGLEVAA